MELKLKEEYKEQSIWVSFDNTNVICKFIDKGLYPHLYKVYPHIFEVILNEVDKEELKASKQKVKDIINVIFEIEELKEAEEKKEK